MTRRTELPPFAETYIAQAESHHAERVVVLFHRWLQRTGRALGKVRGADVAEFVAAPTGRPVKTLTANTYRYDLRLYLRWLEGRGLAGPFEAQELEGYHRRALPDEVRRFLQSLAPTRRSSTVKLYLSVLRRFHEWLGRRGLTIGQVTRGVCLEWAQHLHEAKLHPATRVGMLVNVRRYLDWLWEQGLVEQPGYEQILAEDLPKKPQYLPRPLPPAVDGELQGRLRDAESPIALGLYVMRRTGLRVGELRRLERDCVREDNVGNRFLKVPLGKLDSERLVPLDRETLSAVGDLMGRVREGSKWLIEGARERPVSIATYQAMLQRVGGDLSAQGPLVTHRLRHSFASSLMNGGMSLMGIMKLLGHRDQRMTLRYTQIADETVGREYFEALSRISERYVLPRTDGELVERDPTEVLQDVIRWVTKNLAAGVTERAARLLVRRLEAARDELAELRAEVSRAG